MNRYRAFRAWSLVLLTICAGCSGGSGIDLNEVTVSVSPAAVTIAPSGQVILRATISQIERL